RIGRHPSYCSPGEFPGAPDRLYRNLGDGRFEDVSEKAGVAIAGPDAGKSLGVIAFDSEDDGDIDLFVACDQVPNLFFRNDGRGKFREDALIAGLAYSDAGISQAGMGVDAGDIDLDGRQDLVVTNFSDETNAVYLAEPGGRFREASKALGVAGPSLVPLGFGVVLWDFDRDSDLDIYVANGHVQDNIATIRPGMTFAQPDLLLENRDGREFAPVTAASAGAWLERALVGRAVATGDYDNDGDEDLLVVHASGPVALLRNDAAPDARWIAFRLRGTRSNRDGYGAVLRTTFVRAASRSTRVAECRAGRSYTASSDPRVRFGLGRGEVAVERVEIRWPSGIVQTIDRPEIDRVHDVVEPSA
ncbi:MAG TPA: CRTAC1 family protein, partial [Planctomycetota bacterium]|nr:CRTAC1 family protein [Planctomycetota bacterium]